MKRNRDYSLQQLDEQQAFVKSLTTNSNFRKECLLRMEKREYSLQDQQKILEALEVDFPMDIQGKAIVNAFKGAMLCFSNQPAIMNVKEGSQWIMQAAKDGDSYALYILGMMHLNGWFCVKQDIPEARRCLELSASLNNIAAMLLLGKMYCEGSGVKRDVSEGMKWFQMAGKLGEAQAFVFLGRICEREQKNYASAFDCYQKAAELNHSSAMYTLAEYYEKGLHVTKDLPVALEWYLKAAALGHVSSMYALGDFYFNGMGGKRDCEAGLEWYKKAAALNNASAMHALGKIYFNGVQVKQDYQTGIKWYFQASRFKNTAAMLSLAHLFLHGLHIQQNQEKALDLYKEAANLGCSDAMNTLGVLYSQGKYIAKDTQKALELFEAAADLNHSFAMFNLAEFYFQGIAVVQNYETAMQWFKKSAEQGNVDAMLKMGRLYKMGDGVPEDLEAAEQWLRKAADAGSVPAMREMGFLYELEILTKNYSIAREKSLMQAFEWYRKAYYSGDKDQQYLMRLDDKTHFSKYNIKITLEPENFSEFMRENPLFYLDELFRDKMLDVIHKIKMLKDKRLIDYLKTHPEHHRQLVRVYFFLAREDLHNRETYCRLLAELYEEPFFATYRNEFCLFMAEQYEKDDWKESIKWCLQATLSEHSHYSTVSDMPLILKLVDLMQVYKVQLLEKAKLSHMEYYQLIMKMLIPQLIPVYSQFLLEMKPDPETETAIKIFNMIYEKNLSNTPVYSQLLTTLDPLMNKLHNRIQIEAKPKVEGQIVEPGKIFLDENQRAMIRIFVIIKKMMLGGKWLDASIDQGVRLDSNQINSAIEKLNTFVNTPEPEELHECESQAKS